MPMRQNHEQAIMYGMTVAHGLKLRSLAKAVTAEMPIDPTWPPVLLLDPNGAARTALLPLASSYEGLTFFIRNTADAAETLTLEDSTSTVVIGTLAQNVGGVFQSDGVVWRKIV